MGNKINKGKGKEKEKEEEEEEENEEESSNDNLQKYDKQAIYQKIYPRLNQKETIYLLF